MSQSPTLIEAMVTLDNCCDEPMIRNSVFESLKINLCETNQALTSAMQFSIALIACLEQQTNLGETTRTTEYHQRTHELMEGAPTLWRHVQSKSRDPIEEYVDGNIYRLSCQVNYFITNLLILLMLLARPAHDTNEWMNK